MTRFIVKGPFVIPVQKNIGGRAIAASEGKDFWLRHTALGDEKGCYVFGVRAGKGMTPLYAGKATKSFKQEVFAPHRLAKYMTALTLFQKGTPVLFFLCSPITKGAVNKVNIDELEYFLIQAGMKANPGLLNDKKKKVEVWSIGGILRDRQGKPTNAAQEFKVLMGL